MRDNKDSLKSRIVDYLSKASKGASFDKIAFALRIKKRERARFVLALAAMERDGQLIRDKKGRYKSRGENGVIAELAVLNSGYGFARIKNGKDAFIKGRDLGTALPGDTVSLLLDTSDPRGLSGRMLEIISKGAHVFTGKILKDDGKGWTVRSDDYIKFDIPVKNANANHGDKVRFEVEFGHLGEIEAHVLTVYGAADSARVCADAIIDAAGIPSKFSDEVETQAQKISNEGILSAEIAARDDLRNWTIFTIDGADAKDLDDAVSLDRIDNGWRLGVHIADVSHYVRENTLLEKEARLRGTSIYFADRVIPMLPKALSNGICSLNAGEDKLAFSAIMTFDDSGVCLEASAKKTVIRSCLRGVYDEVNSLLEGSVDRELRGKYEQVYQMLLNMRMLADKLSNAAARRGTMNLISFESVFTLDREGHPEDVQRRVSGIGEGIIEQFMIAANVEIAKLAKKRGLPCVYRVHDKPDTEKLLLLEQMVKRLGLKTQPSASPQSLRALMDEAKETRYARLVSDRLLRAMAKARYSDKQSGHFGLSLKDYCHFTAPIRRYPDLAVHRIISAFLSELSEDQVTERYAGYARDSAELSSEYEMRALNAERKCESCYMAEYISKYIGQQMQGIISSVFAFGFFVELSNTVEGMVRIESLNNNDLRFDDIATLTDKIGRPLYTVGDDITIRVVSADVSTGRIDFEPVE